MESAQLATLILSGALTMTAGVLLWQARTALADIRQLRDQWTAGQIAAANERAADRLEVRDLIRAELRQHIAECPHRETTGVRGMPTDPHGHPITDGGKR